jgi:hypothetical protein
VLGESTVGVESCRNVDGRGGRQRGAVVELFPSIPSVEVGHVIGV